MVNKDLITQLLEKQLQIETKLKMGMEQQEFSAKQIYNELDKLSKLTNQILNNIRNE